jgi:hypothetical protein
MDKFVRNCPSCKSEIFYTSKNNRYSAEKKESKCKKCSTKETANRKDVKEKISKRMSGENNPGFGGKIWKGRKHSAESIEKIKKSKEKKNPYFQSMEFKEKMSEITAGEKNPMYGKSVYSIWTEKYGKEIADEKWNSFKEKISKKTSGEGNPMYGKVTPQGSGNGWSGWYKGWYFRSILELSYMVNIIERFNLKWETAEKSIFKIPYIDNRGMNRNYNADFIIEEKYMIEIKPNSLKYSKEVTKKREFAEKWCEKNNLKYKITNCKKLEDKKLYEMISSGEVIITEIYKNKFNIKYKNL